MILQKQLNCVIKQYTVFSSNVLFVGVIQLSDGVCESVVFTVVVLVAVVAAVLVAVTRVTTVTITLAIATFLELTIRIVP
jgi:hypothetical protein